MHKKSIILIIGTISCGIGIIPLLNKKQKEITYNVEYSGKIQANHDIIIKNSFSGQISMMTPNYHIYHNIHIKENNKDILTTSIIQDQKNGREKSILQDYRIQTGQGNHRLTIFEQEILKKNNTITGLSHSSGLSYNIEHTEGLFLDHIMIKGTYINQFNQKNNFDIIINSNCGISKYISNKERCNIYGKIGLDLPINNYTKERTIQGVLYKQRHI